MPVFDTIALMIFGTIIIWLGSSIMIILFCQLRYLIPAFRHYHMDDFWHHHSLARIIHMVAQVRLNVLSTPAGASAAVRFLPSWNQIFHFFRFCTILHFCGHSLVTLCNVHHVVENMNPPHHAIIKILEMSANMLDAVLF